MDVDREYKTLMVAAPVLVAEGRYLDGPSFRVRFVTPALNDRRRLLRERCARWLNRYAKLAPFLEGDERLEVLKETSKGVIAVYSNQVDILQEEPLETFLRTLPAEVIELLKRRRRDFLLLVAILVAVVLPDLLRK